MKKFFVLLIALLMVSGAMAQTKQPCFTCLPEGIWFTTQAQIDSFQVNYPNCTEIEGDVNISGSDITNMNGLNNIISFGGILHITNCSSLQNIIGLENTSTIGEDLIIGNSSHFEFGNPVLEDLSGLIGLEYIGGSLIIMNDNVLTDLSGLDNLDNIEGSLLIGGLNPNFVYGNSALTNITSLSNLNHIGGAIMMLGNISLTSLSGLENITSLSGYLTIMHNHQLNDLTGIDNIVSIGGDLIVADNSNLYSLTGIDNLDSISGSLKIGYHQTWTLGDTIWGNPTLLSLSALQNVSYVGSSLTIIGNSSLNSLTGLDNINADSVFGLYIHNNPSLSICEVKSICDYLGSPNDTIDIHDNAAGCNSPEEVDSACAYVSIGDLQYLQAFLIYPNPSSNTITIELPNSSTPNKNTFMTITNINGQQIIKRQMMEQQTVVNVSGLSQGIYFVRVVDVNGVMMGKFVKN